VEPNRENIEDLMHLYGYEENEAEAAYYLMEARERFTKMYKDEAEKSAEEEAGGWPKLWAQMFLMSNVNPHFQALSSLLAKRVLGRDYREGWGEGRKSRSARDEEGQPG